MNRKIHRCFSCALLFSRRLPGHDSLKAWLIQSAENRYQRLSSFTRACTNAFPSLSTAIFWTFSRGKLTRALLFFGRIEKIDDILLALAMARKREEPALRRGVAAGHVLWAEEDDDAGSSDRPAHPKSARQKSVKSITGANFFTKHASRLICCGFGIASSITRSITKTAFGKQHATAQSTGRCARPDGAQHAIFDKAAQASCAKRRG